MGRISIAPIALLALAACGGGGGGVSSASGCFGACPASVLPGGGATPTPTPTPPPTPGNGTGGGLPGDVVLPGTISNTAPVLDKTTNAQQLYTAIGATQQMRETVSGYRTAAASISELYQGEQRPSGISVNYDPRAAVFSIAVSQASAGATTTFQDPAHRTAFGGSVEPQASAPNSASFTNGSVLNYLETGSGSPDKGVTTSTFFYQEPGSNTRYVSLAGYVRNVSAGLDTETATFTRTRSVFAFGNQTAAGEVPTSGSGTFTGNMLGTMAFNDTLDTGSPARTRFEWISGTASLNVNFREGTVAAAFTGAVLGTTDAFTDLGALNPSAAGRAFSASGTASFSNDRRSYSGKIDTATLGSQSVSIIASSMDGAFFGPRAAETGGGFRIIGGIPDQRVDIIGAFTGVKPAN